MSTSVFVGHAWHDEMELALRIISEGEAHVRNTIQISSCRA